MTRSGMVEGPQYRVHPSGRNLLHDALRARLLSPSRGGSA